MKRLCLFLFSLVITTHSFAQDDLFGTAKGEVHKGFVIGVNGNFDIPAADMAKRFGLSYRVGPSVFYKTKKNLIIGAKCDFVIGDKVKEDSLMINIKDADGGFIGQNGLRLKNETGERGYMIGLQFGKIFNVVSKNPDNGILVLTAIGFIQHKIYITNPDNNIYQLRGDYKKGYDRLTNGWFVEQYAGYNFFGKNGFINFHLGLDIMAGFTKGRRDFLYDVQRNDDDSRVDILFGIRGGWYIPIFKKKSEELFFE